MKPWRMLTEAERSRFVYDDRLASQRGYIVWIQQQNHVGCGCMLSKPTAYYRAHRAFWGEFPVSPLVFDDWKRHLARTHPGLAVGPMSYGILPMTVIDLPMTLSKKRQDC